MEHTPAAQFRIPGQPTAAAAPAFDPEHPDAEILEAFANYGRLKVWAYEQEDIHESNWPAGSPEQADDAMAALESTVLGNHPTTPAGVAAQLTTTLPMIEQANRSFDRGVVEKGILPFYENAKSLDLDGPTQQLLAAIYALIDMEWEQALATYERSAEDFRLAEALSDLTADEKERPRTKGETTSPYVAAVSELAHQMLDRRTDGADLRRLLRTLTPSPAAYRRKAEIVIAGRLGTIAAPWMLRDIEFLTARLDPPTP